MPPEDGRDAIDQAPETEEPARGPWWFRAREDARRTWQVWKERRYARSAARAALADFCAFRSAHTDQAPRDLYIAWIERRMDCDRAEALRVVRQAAASFAEWPNDSELCFRHIVQYTVIVDYLASHPKHSGTTANMVLEIADRVPLAL